jgi:H+-translocating diphosphatase
MSKYDFNNRPVKELVRGCKQGAAINIILGLALGFYSNILPTLLIGGTVFFSYKLAGMYGIALAAIGMLGNLAICLAIDGYGPISDNAGGLATMCNLNERIRERTDDLDSAGNTTAAIGKGFAIGSACLVAFALFGAFVTRTNVILILNSLQLLI